MKSITLDLNPCPKVTIEVEDDGEGLETVIDRLLIPALLAAGYQPATIKRYIWSES